jgi:hypothetical protein
MMRLARWFFIGVSVVILAGCSQGPKYVLESSVGTYLQQINPGSSDTKLGTVFVIKLQTDVGERSSTEAKVSITGPKSWNADQAFMFTQPPSFYTIAPNVDANPLTGAYTITVDIAGQRLEQQLTLATINNQLPLATISATVQPTKVDVTWETITGARSYYAKLLNTASGRQVGETLYTLSTQTTFTDSLIVANGNYAVALYAANFDTTLENPDLPEALAFSDSIASVQSAASLGPSNIISFVSLEFFRLPQSPHFLRGF